MNAYTLLMNAAAAPRVDVAETKEAYRLTAELPGVSQDQVTVQVTDGVLELKAAAPEAGTEQDTRYLVRERARLAYERSFRLPRDVDSTAIAAVFTNGLLVLTLPKLPEAQPRTVVVQAA